MSEQNIITSEAQLRETIRMLWAQDATLHWRWKKLPIGPRRGYDDIGEVALDKRRIPFCVEFKLNPAARDVEVLAKQKQPYPRLIIAPNISATLARLCQERGLSCADLNGRLWLRTEGVLIEREAKRTRFRPAVSEPDLFSGKSVRLVRTLLGHGERGWTHKELVERTGLSKGLVSRLSRHMIEQGLLAQRERILVVQQRDALLDAWAARDEWRKRTTVQQYSLLVNEPREIAARLPEFLGEAPHSFTQWIAGWLRHPYTLPPVVTAYVSEFPNAIALEKKLLARRVQNGGRLWLVVPKDTGLLRETQTVDGFRLAADVQIYLDLLRAGQRGDEQAAELRKWPDFGRGQST